MLPKVFFVGRLVRDVEVSYTQGGTAIGKLTVAGSRKYKENTETTFLECVAFGALVEKVLLKYTTKGSLVAINGVLKQENWATREGQKRSRLVLQIEGVELLGKAEGVVGKNSSPTQSSTPDIGTDDEIPF